MNKTKYTVDYFIAKFEATPAKKWITGEYRARGGRCAMGHCGYTYGAPTDEALALLGLFEAHFPNTRPKNPVVTINDNSASCPPEFAKIKTPRARILAALQQIKKGEK